MGEIDWRQIISSSQKELSPKNKENLYESVAWMDTDDIEINFGDLKSLFVIAQDLMKFKAVQVETMTGKIDAMVQQEKYNQKGDVILIEQIVQQEEEIRANKDVLDQLYRDIASLQEHKDKTSSIDKESTSSKDPLSELNDIKQLEMTISQKNYHLKKMLADLQSTEAENFELRDKLTNIKEKLSEATAHISQLTDQVTKLKSQSSQLKGKIMELEERKTASLVDLDGLKQELRESEAIKNATIEELKLNIDFWKDSSTEKQTNIDIMTEEILALKTQLKCLKDDTYLAQTVKRYKHQIKNLQTKLTEASQEIENSANVIEKLRAENKVMKEAVKTQTPIIDESSPIQEYTQEFRMEKVKQKLQHKLADAREIIRSREEEIADLSGQIQIFHRDDGIKILTDNLHQQKRQLKTKDERIKSLVSEINSMNKAIDNLQLENVAMREKLNLQPEEKVSTVGILGKFRQMEKRAEAAERKLSQLEDSHLTLQLQAREGRRGERGRERGGGTHDRRQFSGLDGGGDAPSYLSLQEESRTAIETVGEMCTDDMQDLINENEGLRKGLHEILDSIKESAIGGKSTGDIGSSSLDKVTATLDARHAAGWYAPHLATSTHLQRAIGARDALSSALDQIRREAYEVIDKLAKETQKTSDLQNKLVELQKDKIERKPNSPDQNHGKIKRGVLGNWMTEEVFDTLDLDEKDSVQEVLFTSVDKKYVLQLQEGLAHFHEQFNSLYKQMTDLSVKMSKERQEWELRDEQYRAQVENLKSRIAASDSEQNSDDSVGAVHSSKVVLQRRCTYLEESFRNVRTANEHLKNEYFASEKDKLVKIGNYESQIQSLIINMTACSDRLRNSVPIDFFIKQNVKYNTLNLKYRNLLDMKMQQHDITQNNIACNETMSENTLEGPHHHEEQLAEVLQAGGAQDPPNAAAQESAEEGNARAPRPERANGQIQHAQPYTRQLEKKLLDLQQRQNAFIDGALSHISREQYAEMEEQARRGAHQNQTLRMEIAKVTHQLQMTTLQLHNAGQRQFCNDTEVNSLHHQILDLQSCGDNRAVIARLSGEVLVSQLQAADMQRRLERAWSELRNEQRRRREVEQRCASLDTSAQMHASTYHFRLGFLNEVLQILREQYDGALPIVSIENYVNKLNEITSRSRELETVQRELQDLKVTCQAKYDSYSKVIAAAQCGLKDNDCPHYIQSMLNKRVSARELEHSNNKVRGLEESRLALSGRCATLEHTIVTLTRARRPSQLLLQDVSTPSPSPSPSPSHTHGETQILTTPKILPRPNAHGESTGEGSMSSPHYRNTQTVQIDSNDAPHTVTHSAIQTESIIIKSSLTQTEDVIADSQKELYTKEINSLSLDLARKEEELKHIVNKAEGEKMNWQREVAALIHQENDNKQYIEKLVGRINYLDNQISQLQTAEEKSRQKASALNEALKQKDSVMQECRELLKKERIEYMSKAAASQNKVDDLQTHLDKIIIESNNLRAALVQPTNLKAMSDIVDEYTARIGSLQDKCSKLQDTLDTCDADLVSCQAEAARWKALALERFNKLEQLDAKLAERHGHEVEWYRVESNVLQQLCESEHTLCELRQSRARAGAGAGAGHLPPETQLKLSESDLESHLASLREKTEPHTRVHSPNMSRDGFLTPSRSSSASKSVRVQEVSLPEPEQGTATSRQGVTENTGRPCVPTQTDKHPPKPIHSRVGKSRPAASAASRASHAHEDADRAQRSVRAAHVAMWDKWKMCERSAKRWRGQYEAQNQQVKILQARLSSARAAVQRLQKEKRILLDRGNHIISSTSADVGLCASLPPPLPPPSSLLARVEAQQRRIVALQLNNKGNEILVREYELLLAQNLELKKINLELHSQLIESQLTAGTTAADAQEDDKEVKHLRRYVEMLKMEIVELREGVAGSAGGGSAREGESGGARGRDLQRTVLTLRGLVAKLQADNKHLSAHKRTCSELHFTGDKHEELLRVENANPNRSLVEGGLPQRSGDAASRPGELLHQISVLEHTLQG